jgi:hypothetical protein
MNIKSFTIIVVVLTMFHTSFGQFSFQLAVLKYAGGGDYYANPTALPNLIRFVNDNLKLKIDENVPYVEAVSLDIFNYPFIHMTGHGNVVFTNSEAENLKNYLLAGGFLHIDDNYGMDQFIRPEIAKIFPNEKLIEIPVSHKLFNQTYSFNGLPKIHEHDNKRPQAFAIFKEERMVLLYTYETDLGDGWEDQSVHNDKPEKREMALKMGSNILEFVFLDGGIE